MKHSLKILTATGCALVLQSSLTFADSSATIGRANTLGAGGIAASNAPNKSVLLSPNVAVRERPVIGADFSVLSAEYKNSGVSKGPIETTAYSIFGQIPVTKLAGAKYASGFSLKAQQTDVDFKLEPNDKSGKYDQKKETQAFGAGFSLGVANALVGLSYFNYNLKEKRKVDIDKDTTLSGYSTTGKANSGNFSLHGTVDVSDTVRIAANYQPKVVTKYKHKGSFYNDSDENGSVEASENFTSSIRDSENDLETFTIATGVRLNEGVGATSLHFAVVREVPTMVKLGDGEETEEEGGTAVSASAEVDLGTLTPRAGLSNTSNPSNWEKDFFVGLDIAALDTLVVSVDALYAWKHNSEVDSEIRGFGGGLAIASSF